MAVNAKVGSFTRPAAGTTNTVVTGLGFQPNSILFLPTDVLTANTWRAEMQTAWSAYAPSPLAQGLWVTSARIAGNDGNASPNTFLGISGAIRITNGSGSTQFQAFGTGSSPITMQSDGFTINWEDSPYDGEQSHISYLALGGDIKGSMRRVSNSTENVSITSYTVGQRFLFGFDIPFQPDGAWAIGSRSTIGDDNVISLGVIDSQFGQWSLTVADDQVDPTENFRVLSDDGFFTIVDHDTGAIVYQIKALGFRRGYIDAEVIVNSIAGENVFLDILFLSGATFTAGTTTKPTGAAPQTQDIAVKGAPKAVILATHADTNLDTVQVHIRASVGFSDGTNHRAVAIQYEDNATTSSGDTYFSNAKALVKANNTTPSIEAEATVAHGTDKITLTWNPNDGVATRFAYFVLSEVTALSGKATISIVSQNARLAETHPLTGHATISIGNPNQPAWLGSSSIGTHLLTGNASISIGGPAVPLRLNHGGKLTGAASISVTTGHTWQVQSHPLTGAASISVTAPSALLGSAAAILSGSALIEVSTAAHLRTGARLTGNALIALSTDSLGLGGADLPIPTTLRDIDLVGTVNLCRNPSFELSKADATGINSATLDIDSTPEAWHGSESLIVTLPNDTNCGVRITSQRGLPYLGTGWGFLAQVRLRNAVTGGVTLQSTIVYADASTAAGPTVSATPDDDGWTTAYVPVVESTASKQIDYVVLDILRPSAAASETLAVDGVQIELDRGHGHTAWAIGTFGSPYFRWQGGAHFSITVRDAIPADDTPVGTGGVYRLAPALWKVDANNIFLEDLSAYVVNGSATFDPDRDVSWQLNCTLTGAGWKRLEPWKDWLAPRLAVTLPDGTIREGQLGHFVVLPSPQEIHEGWRTVDVDARSGEFLLSIQGTKGIMTVRENTQYDRAVRVVLDNCHLGTDGVRPRYAIPNTNARTHRFMSWEKKEDALTIVNDLLRKDGLEPLYATKTGVLTSQKRKERRYKHMEPVRVYAANLPDETVISPWVGRRIVSQNEVIDAIQTTPDLGRIDDNKIVVVSVNPRKPRIRAVRYINDPDNPISTRKRKRIRERKIEMDVGNNADAEKLAEAIADEISSDLETVTLSVIPDPQTEFARQVVFLAIYDAHGEPAAVGRFKVKTVTYGFTPDEAAMQLTLGFVNPVEQLDSFDATGYDVDGVWEWE